jgi:hypothetical protein
VPPPDDPKREPPGVLLLVAVVATAVEAIALSLAAIGLTVYQASGHRPQSTADSWGVVAMAAAGAIGLGFVVRGLARRRRWARSPAVLTQLIGLPIGIGLSGNGGAAVGVPLAVCTAVALVGLLAPATSRAFEVD